MSAWNAMGAGGRAAIGVMGAVGIVALGYVLFQVGNPVVVPPDTAEILAPLADAPPTPLPPPVAEEVASPAPEAASEAASEPASEPDPDLASDAVADTVTPPDVATSAPSVTVSTQVPTFDNWRLEGDGAAVVSGRAAAGSTVTIMVDNAPVAEARAGASGEFAALFTLPPNDNPSLMSLTATLPDGGAVASDQLIALEAIAGPILPTAEIAAAAAAADLPVATDGGDVATPSGAGGDTTVVASSDPAASETQSDDAEGDLAVGDLEPSGLAAATTAPDSQVPDAPAAIGPDAQPVAILLTEEGAVVLQDPVQGSPASGATVMIETIAYTPEGDVQVGGRAEAGAFLRFYLDNAAIQELAVPATGQWLATLVDTSPGLYVLRVDQVAADGTVTSRFETPFKRETLGALASVAAEDGAEDVAQADAVADAAGNTPAITPADPAADLPSDPEPAQSTDASQTAAAPPRARPVTVTVQPGFTLWGIAKENFGSGILYVQVFDANREKIKDPNLIYPGQIFAIPPAAD